MARINSARGAWSAYIVCAMCMCNVMCQWYPSSVNCYGGTSSLCDPDTITLQSSNSDAHITQICLNHGERGNEINAIESVRWSDGSSHNHVYGEQIGTSVCTSILAGASECFNQIWLSYGSRIDGLEFTTNQGVASQLYGGGGGEEATIALDSNTCWTALKLEVATSVRVQEGAATIHEMAFLFKDIVFEPTQSPTQTPTALPTLLPSSTPSNRPTDNPTASQAPVTTSTLAPTTTTTIAVNTEYTATGSTATSTAAALADSNESDDDDDEEEEMIATDETGTGGSLEIWIIIALLAVIVLILCVCGCCGCFCCYRHRNKKEDDAKVFGENQQLQLAQFHAGNATNIVPTNPPSPEGRRASSIGALPRLPASNTNTGTGLTQGEASLPMSFSVMPGGEAGERANTDVFFTAGFIGNHVDDNEADEDDELYA